jgi:hypothetical protein
MKIIIDIGHPAHVNFFKPIVNKLINEKHEIYITVLRRGKLPEIAKKEFVNCQIFYVGRHRGTKWSIIVEANLIKFFQIWRICNKIKPNFGLSAGSFNLGAVLKTKWVRNIQFDDDPERKVNVFLEKLTSSTLYFPIFYNNPKGKVKKYNALKEWSYLSPNYFTPNLDILKQYGLTSKNYIFIREISTGSLNYINQKKNIIASICHEFSDNVQFVLSLEDKSTINDYPSNWIILKEPIDDIHSIIYYSKCLISSGDSMAREAAVLGVPSIFCGLREMKANSELINKGMMQKVDPEKVALILQKIIDKSLTFENQNVFREKLLIEWEDVANFVLKLIIK